MSEIEKMYSNAGIKLKKVCTHVDCDCDEMLCDECKYFKDNIFAFTAEKQIELIKWLAQKDYYTCDYCEIEPRKNGQEWLSYCHFKGSTSNTFEKALAGLINEMWLSLTEEEKQQVKGILE